MPRDNHKNRRGRRREEPVESASDDESVNENNSEWSAHSDNRSVQEDADDVAEDGVKTIDQFEEVISAAVEGLNQKSVASRVKCWIGLANALKSQPAINIITGFRLTITDHLEKALKRQKPEEQAAAADVAALMAIQFAGTDVCEELSKDIRRILLTVALDKSANANVRSKCCSALGMITFLAEEDIGNIYETMRNFETIFSGSYLKGDGSIKSNVTSEQEALHYAALSSWSLLLTLCSPGDIYMMMSGSTNTFAPSLRQLGGMLASPGLEIRLAAGESLALAFELGREHSVEFGEQIVDQLIGDIKELATDSHKYRAKKDRKTQRATFRDILKYLEEDDIEEITLKLQGEQLHIEGWCARRRYAALASVLGAGLHPHLGASTVFRAALGLPPPPLVVEPRNIGSRNSNKLLRQLQNAAAFKARTITRGRNRDKRSAVIVS